MAVIYILALDATRQGGAGVYTWALVENLAARGHNITLICHEAAAAVKELAKVIILPRISGERPFGMWRFSSWLQLRDYKSLLRDLKLGKPDAVIGSAQPMILPYMSLYPSHPLIYLPHSLIAPVEINSYPFDNRLQQRIAVAAYRFMEKKCLMDASVTVRFTETACAAFLKYYGDSCCKRLVSISMPIKKMVPLKNRTADQALRLLSVGRLIKSKNNIFLLEILAGFQEERWVLDIVGSGNEMEMLQEYVRGAGLDDRVKFHGHVDDVSSFYQSADLFLFPSLLENSPVVLLEAMGYALPTLSFHSDNKRYLGANHEIVEHDKTGFLAADGEDFERLLKNIISRRVDISGIGARAYRHVEEYHGWDRHIQRFEQLIDRAGKSDNEN